jgi:hypothetical protein
VKNPLLFTAFLAVAGLSVMLGLALGEGANGLAAFLFLLDITSIYAVCQS